jgi:DNA-binding NarL/FixJ family response regulator
MVTAGHARANSTLQQEVTTAHPRKIALPSDVTPTLEALIRKLIAQARNGSEACAGVDNDRKGQVIIDTEVDGVRCLLTRLEKPLTPRISFSPRESEIARMVAKGYPNKTIAAVLEISSWTVSTHIRRMFAKLGVSSRTAMVVQMMDAGMLGHTDDLPQKYRAL